MVKIGDPIDELAGRQGEVDACLRRQSGEQQDDKGQAPGLAPTFGEPIGEQQAPEVAHGGNRAARARSFPTEGPFDQCCCSLCVVAHDLT
ncbi:hypothetical protein D9M70_535750 [compost metagenome]